jgi:hypothetical protein
MNSCSVAEGRMTPQEYLTKAQARWRGLPDAELAGLNDDERSAVRQLEAQAAQLEFAALTDIIVNCHNKYQFAKTYKVLRADLRNTLAQPGNPKASEQVNRAMKAAFQLVGQQKLSEMAGWFLVHFADDHDIRQVQKAGVARIETAIEVYAGKEGAGCAGVVLLALGAGLGSLALRFVM